MTDNSEDTADGCGPEEDDSPEFDSCLYYTDSTDDEGAGTDNDAIPSIVCVKSPIKKAKLVARFQLVPFVVIRAGAMEREPGMVGLIAAGFNSVKLSAEGGTMCTRDWHHSFKERDVAQR